MSGSQLLWWGPLVRVPSGCGGRAGESCFRLAVSRLLHHCGRSVLRLRWAHRRVCPVHTYGVCEPRSDRRLNRAHRHEHPYDPRPHRPRYVEKRRAEGHAAKAIRRCLNRYLARQIYHAFNATDAASSPLGKPGMVLRPSARPVGPAEVNHADHHQGIDDYDCRHHPERSC